MNACYDNCDFICFIYKQDQKKDDINGFVNLSKYIVCYFFNTDIKLNKCTTCQ